MAKAKTLSPDPVYAATFEDGESIRLSFAQPIGKPWDIARCQRMVNLIYAGRVYRAKQRPSKTRRDPYETYKSEVAFKLAFKPPKHAAVIEHHSVGKIAADNIAALPKRKTSALDAFKAEVRNVINNGSDLTAILAQVSDLVAA